MANAFGKIIANVERLHRLMDEEGVSAIVARSGKNFTYLARGLPIPAPWPATWTSPIHPEEVLLIWPQRRRPGAWF